MSDTPYESRNYQMLFLFIIVAVAADVALNSTRRDSESFNVFHKSTWTISASALLQREYLQTNSGF